MDPAILFVLLGGLGLFVVYWVIRAAVSHGILDADAARQRAVHRRAFDEVLARPDRTGPEV